MLFRFVIGRKVAWHVRARTSVCISMDAIQRVVHGGIWPSIVLRDVCHHQSSHCSLELRVLPCTGKSRKCQLTSLLTLFSASYLMGRNFIFRLHFRPRSETSPDYKSIILSLLFVRQGRVRKQGENNHRHSSVVMNDVSECRIIDGNCT